MQSSRYSRERASPVVMQSRLVTLEYGYNHTFKLSSSSLRFYILPDMFYKALHKKRKNSYFRGRGGARRSLGWWSAPSSEVLSEQRDQMALKCNPPRTSDQFAASRLRPRETLVCARVRKINVNVRMKSRKEK